jgi:uncharacterized membrane protein
VFQESLIISGKGDLNPKASFTLKNGITAIIGYEVTLIIIYLTISATSIQIALLERLTNFRFFDYGAFLIIFRHLIAEKI